MKKIIILNLLIVGCCFSCSDDSKPSLSEPDLNNYYADKEVEVIFENDPENGINVIFLGDAYLRKELEKTDGKYRHDGMQSIEFLFNSHPFLEYKEHFNAYIIYAESSIENTENGIVTHNPFDSSPEPYTTVNNLAAIDEYVFELKGRSRNYKDLILMGVNNLENGSAMFGSNIAVYGTLGSETIQNNVFFTMLHEVGHAFGSLGDEYINPNLNLYSTDPYANLDHTNDLNSVKWSHFIGLDQYPEVGAYEGGGYAEVGIWRPEAESIMGFIGSSHFNAPSREAIVKKIMNLKGLDYDFEAFVTLDSQFQSKKNSGAAAGLNKEEQHPGTIHDIPETSIKNCLLFHHSIIQR